jgi:CheY-like chemotaxis protein
MIKLNRWTEIAQAERIVTLQHIQEIETALLNEVTHLIPDDIYARPSVVFNHRLPSKCDSMSIDLRLLVDCIQPLVVNAMQNTVGGVVALTLTVDEDYQTLTVDVRDNGRGILVNDQERILLPYEKVDAHTTGAGLGLTLACRVATLMGGSVSLISSEVDKGSHFRATFNAPACACSFSPSHTNESQATRPPCTFRRLPTSSPPLSLSSCFASHLIGHGYIESAHAASSMVVLDYTPNLAALQRRTMEVGTEEVAICLVPDTFFHVDLRDKHLCRDGNIIYVRGPFTSKTLDDALRLAQSTLEEILSSPNPRQACDSDLVMVETPLSDRTNASTQTPTHALPPPLSIPPPIPEQLAVRVEELHLTIPSLAPTASIATQSTKPMTLLVDDNAVNLRLLEMYCKRRGLPYCTAADGQQAVKLVRLHRSLPPAVDGTSSGYPLAGMTPFRLILMDLQMPICDGITATEQIRGLELKLNWDKSTIFMVTGQDSISDRTDAENAGADEYLVKPVGPKNLDLKLKQWFPGFG